FFDAMPGDSGFAFVLVPHLAPARRTLLPALLSRHTTMPVVEVTQGMPVQPDHVYVIPPNQYLTIAGGALHLTGPIEPHGAPTTIDRFLRSLAEDRGAKAVGVLLSGTGSYGTLGLAAVRGSGGMTLVQDPATAECGDMPRHAIAAGLA